MPAMRAVLALVVCASLSLGAENAKLRTLTGKIVEGELVSLSGKEIVIKASDDTVTTPVVDILDLDVSGGQEPNAPPKYVDLELIDGSLLHASQIAFKGTEIEADLFSGQKVKLPLAAVASYLNNAQDPKVREQWQTASARKPNSDLGLIENKEGVVSPVPGTFGEVDDKGETIMFETEGGHKGRIRLARIHAIVFFHKPVQDSPETLCKVHDASGNTLNAAGIATGDAGFTVTTVAGPKIDLSRQLLVRLDFSHGKLAYLSDLEPVRAIETSTVERVEHYRRDRNLDGNRIQLDKDTRPEKGLSLHAYTELVYDLSGQYDKLKAILGVDTGVGGDSHVKVAFEGDGKRHTFDVKRKDGLTTVEDEGGDLGGGIVERKEGDQVKKEGPQDVKLDVTNIKQLRIIVSTANLLDLGDQVTLGDAKVSK